MTASTRRHGTRQLQVELGARSYPIRIGNDLIADAAVWREVCDRPLRLLCDENVARDWLKPLVEVLWRRERDAEPLDTPERQAGLEARLMQAADPPEASLPGCMRS